jgi:hypothetical protein
MLIESVLLLLLLRYLGSSASRCIVEHGPDF